jgi:hypothetical protein
MSFSFRLVSGRSVIGSGVASVLGKLPNLQASAGFRSAEWLLRIDHPFRSPERDEERTRWYRRAMVHPAAHGLIGDQDPTLSQQILDVAKAQGELEIEPDRLQPRLALNQLFIRTGLLKTAPAATCLRRRFLSVPGDGLSNKTFRSVHTEPASSVSRNCTSPLARNAIGRPSR